MTADFSYLKDGWYIGAIYDGDRSMTGSIRFHIHRATDGIDEIETETGTSYIYDLNGIHQSSPKYSGILIIEGKKVIMNN